MTQLDVFAPPSTMDAAFWKYHKDNPEILTTLIDMTEKLKNAGRTHIGMKMLFEAIRYHTMLEAKDGEFKINNNYTSRYVRLIEEQRPDLGSLFETRTIKS